MSWEAVAWANRQKLKKSYEQIVLLVLANCADPNGEAFAKWPGREHWWVYLSERTRLPKSSLFRHLNTLVALGLGDRSIQVLADGSRRPTFKLNMEAAFDIEAPEDAARYLAASSRVSAETQSPGETGHEAEIDGAENDSDFSGSQADETTIAPQSPGETGANDGASLRAGTDPFPVLGMQKDSIPFSKDSPLPPSGGLPAVDELFDEFRKVWREPIPKMALARSAWDHIATVKRGEVVAAAKGYFAWLAKHPKPPAIVSAQSFLRDEAGWVQWLRYVPDANGAVPSITSNFPVASEEGKAVIVLHEMVVPDLLRNVMIRSGVVSYLLPMTSRLRAMAQAGPRESWARLSRQQAGAWDAFAGEAVKVPRRKRLREGDLAPWEWPPTVEGRVYIKGSDPPPDQLMTDDDFDNFR